MFSVIDSDLGPIAILNIPKVGSQTLAALEVSKVGLQDSDRLGVKIAFVREPVERLVSAFHFFNSFPNKPYPKEVDRNWTAFVDWALESSDIHVRPQHHFCYRGNHAVFTQLLPIEKMTQVLEMLRGHKIESKNVSKKESPVDMSYRIEDILSHYEKDSVLYELATLGL